MNSSVLNNFIQAQNPIYPMVLQELNQGKKRTHWMWFVFPQIKGLGRSAMAQRFAIDNLDQAQAYIQNPVLGTRLRECAELLLTHPDKSAFEILGKPDDRKLHSSLTLFALVDEAGSVFAQLLQQFYDGQYDERTLQILAQLNAPTYQTVN